MTAVGIVTLPSDTNYGNRLQNFALQEVIASLGASTVETIEGLPRHESKILKARRLSMTALDRRGELVDHVLGRGNAGRAVDTYTCPDERRSAIRGFVDRNIHVAPKAFLDGRPNTAMISRYDRVVVGSDQVWNPAFTHGNPEWFLSFVPHSRRIAYAASFGISEIPSYLKGCFRKGLNLIPALSVREHQAARLVKKLTGRCVPVVLDPTMLIEPGRWASLARLPAGLNTEEYVALFSLSSGDGPGTTLMDLTRVTDYARQHALTVVDLHDPVEPSLQAMGPLDFIGAIKGAVLLVTDSYHAAVFSALFHVPFLLVRRGSMNSRFETLLRETGLCGRMLNQLTSDFATAFRIDWAEVDARLRRRRRASLDFLAHALGFNQTL